MYGCLTEDHQILLQGGENYDDVVERERIEALKGTSIKKGTKEYEYVLKNGETPDCSH